MITVDKLDASFKNTKTTMRQTYKMIYLYLVEKTLFVSEVNALALRHYSIPGKKQLACSRLTCRNNERVPQDLSIEKNLRIFTRR